MANEDVKITWQFVQNGLGQILKQLDSARAALNKAGVDAKAFDKQFVKIEQSANRAAAATRKLGAETKKLNSAGPKRNDKRDDIGGRNYRNISTAMDDMIAAREKVGKDFASSIKARMEAEVRQEAATKKTTAATAQAAAAQQKKVKSDVIMEKSTKNTTGALASQRYALYDLARTYTAIGVALAGVGTYAVVMGAQFESAFTNVERTLQTGTTVSEVQGIRQSLVELSSQIPLTFAELSSIATIGNQMGIAKEEIVDFTGTIARFASVSGISIDEVTKAFGGFAAQTGLDPSQFENLGSSIAKVGIDSNATEAQIVALMREITAGARQAGLGADAIVGLSGTLAGLQIAPERARGSLSTYFNTLNKAVAAGGEDLEKFASIVGVTGAELEAMVKAGDGATVLRGFIEGLSDLNNVATTQALDDLGLAQLRVSDTFIRLSSALNIYDRDQKNANEAFMSGAELQRQYAMTVDDLASQWQMFINNLNALTDAISGGAIPGIAALLQMVNDIITGFTRWLGDNDWARVLLVIVGVAATLTGGLFLLRGVLALAQGAMLAMSVVTAQASLSAVAATRTFGGMIGALFGVTAAAGTATRKLQILRAVLVTTGVGALAVGLGFLLEALVPTAAATEDASIEQIKYNDAISGMEEYAGGAADAVDDMGKKAGGAGRQAEEAAKKIRLLTDYMSDLQGVFGRSFDLRFSVDSAIDEVTLQWIKLNEQMEEYDRKVRALTADRSLREYWLGIAEMYDDQIRAAQLREEIAKIDDEMADAHNGASRELKGNSSAAIENRKVMRSLLTGYEDYIEVLAGAGASQEEIQKVISALNGEFQDQAKALGFSADELAIYSDRFSDLTTIVDRVPRNVDIEFNGKPAETALEEFFAKAEESAKAAGGNMGGAMGDAMGAGFPDEIPWPWDEKTIERDGKGRGTDWAQSLWLGIRDFIRDLPEPIKTLIDLLLPATAWSYFTDSGTEAALWFLGGMKGELSIQSPEDLADAVLYPFGQAWGEFTRAGWEVAGDIWEGVKGFWTNITSGDWWASIGYAITGTSEDGKLDGKAIGRSLWEGIGEFWKSLTEVDWWNLFVTALDKIKAAFVSIGRTAFSSFISGFNASSSSTGAAKNTSKGAASDPVFRFDTYASGGYTGPGGKYDPAGIVHKGEYVVPKKHDNQHTGLPDLNYIQSLQRSKPSTSGSYANGGFVGGGMSGPIELGPASLHAIGTRVVAELRVDGRQLASAASRGDSRLARTGAN